MGALFCDMGGGNESDTAVYCDIDEQQENKQLDERLQALIHAPVEGHSKESAPQAPPSPAPLKPTTRVAVPSQSNYHEARARLDQRLRLYNVSEYRVRGDGACQFASVADQMTREVSNASQFRALAIQQLRKYPEYYVEFVEDSSYNEYCNRMARASTWGDHLTLQALADALLVVINLLTSYTNVPHIEVRPRDASKPIRRHIWLSFFGEVHYNSLYPSDQLSRRQELDRNCIIS